MKRSLALVLLLSACSLTGTAPDLAPPEGMTRPMPRPDAGGAVVPRGAATADAFDTTTPEERAAAVAAPEPAGEARLGRTVAALGSPANPGFWLETPLVTQAGPGRVVAIANGKSVQLELRPIDGPAGAGSRISLAALRLLEVGLTGLHELEVFAK
ncbi:D-galactarate dehydratase [Maritimibacter fusiformis]|uniref:D-galactarate dehydratase n=1 Tax=Maritimibacter fusiformis TaxID=2603819 RepID=A0A5D0RIW2_9RHOB|nr:D-galactarate dehydratase [Maritimibacter fusiformis]TYB81402.1 D-galactarate dehydratase [Maritimibacter fusiformis]